MLLFLVGPLSSQPAADTTHREPDTSRGVDRRKLTQIVVAESALYAGSISYLWFIWYRDKERVPFHFYDDSKGYLQVDKLGHTFGAYLQSYWGYRWLRSANVPKKHALLYGATLGIVLQTPIEVFDGMYEGWGFSWPDMAANALGSGIVAGQALLFDEQVVKMKFSFWRSPYADGANGYLGDSFAESLFLDYNGHTYWLTAPLGRLTGSRKLPPWLGVSVGYSAGGMFGEFRNRRSYQGQPLPDAARYRQFLLSLDVDWSRIPTRSRTLRRVFDTLFWLKVPFPALEINSRVGVRGHGVYF
ncbi:MAG: DUF2279 domain-containing protein [Catalinimonas sp.]